MTEVLIPNVNALIVHDTDGDRLFAKYYDGRTKAQQIDFEQMIHKKTKAIVAKNESEVLLLDNEVVVFKSGSDCKFYVAGPCAENELILVAVLESIFDSISSLMKGQVEKKTMLDNLELILLTIDETLDHGNIMELDSSSIVSRVLMKGAETHHERSGGGGNSSTASSNSSNNNMADMTLAQALGFASNSFFKSLTGRGDSY